jgi:hypothetical protein
MMTSMRKKWLFAFLILFGLVLLGFGCYLLTPKPADLSITSHQAAPPNEGPGTTAFATAASKTDRLAGRQAGAQPNLPPARSHPRISAV